MIRIRILKILIGSVTTSWFLASLSFAAIPPMSAPKILSAPSAVIGGVAGTGFSLLGAKKEISAKGKYERIILDIGDYRGQKNLGLPAYYHAQLQKDPSRLVIDFSQMGVSRISQSEMQAVLKDSKFVRQTRLLKDPSDGSMTLILDLQAKTRARVMQVKGIKGTSKVVVDLL